MQSRWLWCSRAIVGAALLAVSACARSPMAPSAGVPLPVGPVQLTLRPPPSQCGFAVPPYQSEYTVRGTLSQDGPAFTFRADRSASGIGDLLTMQLARSDAAVTGTVAGAAYDNAGYPMLLTDRPGISSGSAAVRGTVGSGGTLNGSIDGYMYIVHFVFSIAGGCTGGHQWSLQP